MTDRVLDLMTKATSRQDALMWFLRTRSSEHTARAYGRAIRDYEAVNGSVEGGISREAVSEWVARMGERGMSAATINQRLAALSSFCLFLDSLDLDEDGSAKVTQKFIRRMTRKVSPYERSTYLALDQIRALLDAIDRSTVQGARDYALFLMFVATGRRSTEIRSLRWVDFKVEGEMCWYQWRGKGNRHSSGECPWDVWMAIVDWLNRAGRLVHMQDEDYVFTAVRQSAVNLPRVRDDWRPGQAPLAMQTLGQLMSRYARRAGISGKVHIHMLRHSAAMLRYEAGEDLWDIQKFLDHSDIQATLIYMHRLQRRQDTGWIKIREMLGLKNEN